MASTKLKGQQVEDFSSGAKGVVPASGGGTSNYLRADGTWATPPQGVTAVGTYDSAGNSVDGAIVTGSNIFFHPFSAEVPGLVPPSTGMSTDFLKADGTWGVPSGSGGLSFSEVMRVKTINI